MTEFEKIQTWMQGGMLLVTVLTAIVVIAQIALASRQFRLDHEHRRKQATVDFLLSTVRPQWRSARRKIVEQWGAGPLTPEAVDQIMDDDSKREDIRELLGTLEHLALGVHEGVYDGETIRRGSGRHLRRILRDYRVYIDRVRGKNPTAYSDFETLIEEFERRFSSSEKVPDQGESRTPLD